MSAAVVPLKLADASAKPAMLALLDRIRDDIESGVAVSLVTVTVLTNNEFQVRAEGDIAASQLAGYLAMAQFDIMRNIAMTDHPEFCCCEACKPASAPLHPTPVATVETTWGFIEDGKFVALPIVPMKHLGPPPFDVRLPIGEVRHIIEGVAP